jgi:phosphoglucomutase
MSDLRENPPKKIGGVKVSSIGDYIAGYVYNLETNTKEPTNLIKSDVLYYTLENGDKIIVRPSGTEPKIKIYFLTHGDDETALKNKIETYKKDAKGFAK